MISCVVNFKNNLTQAENYYKLLAKQLSGDRAELHILEHILMASTSKPFSKICEGYQFTAIFSGELWNTEALKNELSKAGYCFLTDTDSELALNTYIHYGEKCVQRLCGSYSIVVYDSMRRQLFAATDSEASYPLYYCAVSDEMLISSDICAVLRHPDVEAVLCPESLCGLLSFCTFPPEGLFEGIRLLPPAHTLKVSSGSIVVSEYKPVVSDGRNKFKTDATVISLADNNWLCKGVAESGQFDRINTISFAKAGDTEKRYSCKHTKIDLCEHMLKSAVKDWVTLSGVPLLSEDEFLLPTVLAVSDSKTVYLQRNKRVDNSEYFDFAVRNRLFHLPVLETLQRTETICGGFYGRTVADKYGVDLKVHYDTDKCKIAVNTDELEGMLRRNLLEVIAKRNSPIIAFFDRGALLKLCEGRLDTSSISTVALMAYLLQLNQWFLEFRPRIV